ncbi:bromodomain-containing 9 isoform X3 [Pelobates cultripes]|uniref:Bromodomain-containing protein 9 n=1 Tax=Pelobates cultripes TaxID=61616 RepID=A0AAD1SRK8_PELCU|nr:bromodomain-containing 9 isoform X3 [Pelobates cultripes]
MGKKHKKHRSEWRSYDAEYEDKPLQKPLKLVLKVGGSEVTELSGSGHDSSYYDDRSDHEQRDRHKEKKKKKKKKSEKEKDKHLDDEERSRRKEEKKRKREKELNDSHGETEYFEPGKKVEVESPTEHPVRTGSSESSPIQQLLEYFLNQLQQKDPHGFFAFPVTDQIAPGYFMIIKHPMDFSTMREKITTNEYKSITEFKADFKLMCENAMTYNSPETVYYKLAKKLLHTGFKMMSKQAVVLGDEETQVEELVPENIAPVPVETTKKHKKPTKEVITCIFEPEGNACSLTDSTAEEHVLALVEHAADEARDKINRELPNSKIGFLKKNADGTLLYSVVNPDPDNVEEETHPVDFSSLSSKLLPSFTTLGFKDDRSHKVTFLNSASTSLSLQNNTLFTDLKPDEMELMYAGYGDETGIQCALSLQEFVKDCGGYAKKIVNDLLDQITGGDHSQTIYQIKQRSSLQGRLQEDMKMPLVMIKEEPRMHPLCPESNSKHMMMGDPLRDGSHSVPDFIAIKQYSDMSLDMINSLGKVKKELDHDDTHLNLDDTAKLLHEFHDVHPERIGSRLSSNIISLSNNSDRDHHHHHHHHHLGSPQLSIGEQQDIPDPYEFLESPDPDSTN